MSDNLRRHRAIKKQLLQLHPAASGRQRQSLCVLAAIISGIVGAAIPTCPKWPQKYLKKLNRKVG